VTDFEHSSAAFEGGSYYMYQDPEGKGVTTPNALANSALVPTTVPGKYDDGKALHLLGDFFRATSWGAGLGIRFDCVDVSTVAGLRVSMKSQLAKPIDVGVATASTQSTEFGGTCSNMPCVRHQVRVVPTQVPYQGQWFEATIPFADLSNAGSFTPKQVVGINFAAVPLDGNGWAFDIQVDNFYWVTADELADAGAIDGSQGAAGASY
jgi:hypothetical protein